MSLTSSLPRLHSLTDPPRVQAIRYEDNFRIMLPTKATQYSIGSHPSRLNYGRPSVTHDRFGSRSQHVHTTGAASFPTTRRFGNDSLMGYNFAPGPSPRQMRDLPEVTSRWSTSDWLPSPKTRASIALLDKSDQVKPLDQVQSLFPPWNETKQLVRYGSQPFTDDFWDPRSTGSQALVLNRSGPLENHTGQHSLVTVAPTGIQPSLAISHAYDIAHGRVPPSSLGGFEPRPQLESSDPDNATIFVGNLEEECVAEHTLRQVFEAFGAVRNVSPVPLVVRRSRILTKLRSKSRLTKSVDLSRIMKGLARKKPST